MQGWLKTPGNQFDYTERKSGQSFCFKLSALPVNKLKLSRYQRTAFEETNTISKASKVPMFLNHNKAKKTKALIFNCLHLWPFSWRPRSHTDDLNRNKLVFSRDSDKVTAFNRHKSNNIN